MHRSGLVVAGLTFCALSSAQVLLVNRPPQSGPSSPPILNGWDRTDGGFVADSFVAGASGEVWMIDRVRVWSIPDPAFSGPHPAVGDLFDSVTLFGGLEDDSPPEVRCTCHHLASLKSAPIRQGSNSSSDQGLRITAIQSGGSTLWQVDFDDVRWSVPGGSKLQFGVAGERRVKADGAHYTWIPRGSAAVEGHPLWWFDGDGKPLELVTPSRNLQFAVQVWGHRVAR